MTILSRTGLLNSIDLMLSQSDYTGFRDWFWARDRVRKDTSYDIICTALQSQKAVTRFLVEIELLILLLVIGY